MMLLFLWELGLPVLMYWRVTCRAVMAFSGSSLLPDLGNPTFVKLRYLARAFKVPFLSMTWSYVFPLFIQCLGLLLTHLPHTHTTGSFKEYVDCWVTSLWTCDLCFHTELPTEKGSTLGYMFYFCHLKVLSIFFFWSMPNHSCTKDPLLIFCNKKGLHLNYKVVFKMAGFPV